MDNNYGSGGWKKWIWLYVLIAIVLYGGIYYYVKNKNNSAATTPATTQTTTPATTTPDTSSTTTGTVSIVGMAFSPADMTVKAGTTVTWTNNDVVSHTVVESDGQTGPASSTLTPGNTYSFTFNTAGTYHYHCTIHPTMTGTITITQ